MRELIYECTECGQELYRCETCKQLFHAREMGIISPAVNHCLEHMAALLARAPITVDVKRKPQNVARLKLVERAN